MTCPFRFGRGRPGTSGRRYIRAVRVWDVTGDEVDEWARKGDAHLWLPELVRRLLFATASIRRLSTRAGAGVFLPDWDLLLDAEKPGEFWPGGVSGWELSTREASRKIRDDIESRARALDGDVAGIAFVAVCARRVRDKQKHFLAAPRSFTSISVLDADDLAAWMSLAPAVGLWFRGLRGEQGFDEVRTLADALRRWSRVTAPPLPEMLLLAGGERQDAAASVRAWAQDPEAKHLSIVADDPHEAALFAAAALALDPINGDQWSARVAFVTAPAGLAALNRRQQSEQTILILDGTFPRESIDPELKAICALAPTEPAGQRRLTLGLIPWSEMARVLAETALGEGADALARDARGRISALRGLLQGADTPTWASKAEDSEALATLLLVGGFQSTNSADIDFVGRVYGRNVQEVLSLCERLKHAEGAPVVVDASRRGNVWGFATPSEAWRFLIRRLPDQLLYRFGRQAVDLLRESPEWTDGDPARDSFMHRRLESDALVQGVCESLARLAQSDDQLPDHITPRGSEIAARVVRSVLADAPRARWASLHAQLQTLGEASPEEFLRALEAGVNRGNDGPVGLLKLEKSGLQYPHVGLLWALEVLAWVEGTLEPIVATLASLSQADTDGNKPGKVISRPLRTLHSLLDPVFPYTNAEDGEILRAIDSLKQWPSVAHAFACLAVAHSGSRLLLDPRKPNFLKVSVPSLKEIYNRRATGAGDRLAAATALGILVADKDPKRWAELLTAATDLRTVGEHLSGVADGLDDREQALWSAIRRRLHHRARLGTIGQGKNKAPGAEEQELLEKLYARFTPADVVVRSEWLFRGRVELPFFAGDWQGEQNEVEHLQLEALEAIHKEAGVDGIVRLILRVGADLIATGAFMLSSCRKEIERAVRRRTDAPILADVYGFMYGSEVRKGKLDLSRAEDELRSLVSEGKLPHALAILRQLEMSDDVLDIIDAADPQLRREYWRGVRFVTTGSSRKDDERPLQGLLDAGNFRTAFEHIVYDKIKVSPSVLYEFLLICATNDDRWSEIQSSNSLAYWLPKAFERIRSSGVVLPDDLAKLALRYAARVDDDLDGLPWLTPLVEKNPSLFHRWAEGGEGTEAPHGPLELSPETATRILFAWRGVPWESADPPLRDDKLYEWAKAILDKGSASKPHSRIATFLAMVLQRAADADGTWPALAVRRLLEDRTARGLLLDELRVARWNARGATSRSLGDGGRQERVLAARYSEDARRLKAEWPSTAKLLSELAKSYNDDARKIDQNTISLSRQEGFEPLVMSGLDVLVALKIASNGIDNSIDRAAWLADQLQVPREEVAVSLNVLADRRFFRADGTKEVNLLRLRNYLLQDPTPFPLRRAPLSEGLGLPTAHSAPILVAAVSDGGTPFVMPLAGATIRGKVVDPIHPRAPFAAERDPKLYALLSLLDALRVGASNIGTARDTELARKKLLETL